MVVEQTKDLKSRVTSQADFKDDSDIMPRMSKFNMRPMLVLMACVGCYSLETNKRKIISALMWIYKGFIMCTIVLYTIRNVSLLSDPMMAQSLGTVILLSLNSIGNLLVCWKTFSTTYGHYFITKKHLEKAISTMTANGISINISYFNRRMVAFCCTSVVLLLTGIAIPTCITFVVFPSTNTYGEIMNQNQTMSLTQPLEDNNFSRIVLLIAVNINILPYCIPGFFLMTMSVMMSTAFNAFNKHLNYVIEFKREQMFESFEKLRQIHVELCTVVANFDKDLCFMYGNIFLWTTSEGLIVLYILVKYPMPTLIQFSMIYYLSLGGAILVTMSICAALVRDAAHAPLDVIYYTDAENTNLDKVTQLNLFLSKLTGTQVGFTVFGLLTITKEFILTLGGVFLTYFVVLYTL